MSFLTPLFLIGALAIAGPVIYHLVRRVTRDRQLFSSLMFLQPSPPRISKRHRFEHLLLLLLRCAALALLALAFSRPFFRQTPLEDPTAADPKRVVILLDTSASMRRDGVWAAARERVETVLRRSGPADQVAIYTFDRTATPLLPFEDWNRAAPGDRVPTALGRVAGIAPGWNGTHLGNALITAAEALAESDGKATSGLRQVVLVSDLQAGSRLDGLQAYEWPKGIELQLEAAKATNPTNAGVSLVADNSDSVRALDAPVRVRVANAADSKREQFKLGWTRPAAAGAPAAAPEWIGAALDAYVPPGQNRVFSVPVPKGVSGLEQISLTGDDEAFDNTAYVIPPAQQKPVVLWLGSDVAEDPKQPLFFLRRAFAETPRVAVRTVASAPAAPLNPADLAAARLVFLTEAVPAATAAALRAHAEAGNTVVVVPRAATIAPALATLLGRESIAAEEVRPANYAMLAEIDFQHPIFAPFADPRFSDFTKIHFWRYRKFDAAAWPGAKVLARFDRGDPALVEVPVGKGRVFVLAAGWQPEDSQLAVSSKFVPLVWSWLDASGSVVAVATQLSVGEAIALPAGPAPASGFTLPDGKIAPVTAGGPAFAAPMPGVFAARTETGAAGQRYAVNLDANESRTAPLGPDELELLGVPVTRQTSAPAATTPADKALLQAGEAENRQKLWRWFVAATLAILVLESALAGWTARRTGVKTEEVPT
ncbi:MAG: hypothetical protein B9S34_15675 [Opitutia bacterium Tous-C1TDCM]|nr:MAG: hypothetical protein B9S34_15675 [Opitutae bacterium Tous-C1TDCM]